MIAYQIIERWNIDIFTNISGNKEMYVTHFINLSINIHLFYSQDYQYVWKSNGNPLSVI